jgi:hypothetical protein
MSISKFGIQRKDESGRAFRLASSSFPIGTCPTKTGTMKSNLQQEGVAQEFARGFDGMTDTRVTVSLKKGEPEWKRLGVDGAETLPAVRWRLENLAKIDRKKRDALIERLREVLQVQES